MFRETYYSKEYSAMFRKNDCPEDMGSEELFVVPIAQFVSNESQEDADEKAASYVRENGQDYANRVGACCKVYYNKRQQGKFYCSTCEEGTKDPLGVVHTIAAGKVYSLDSVEDANREARRMLKEEGQRMADSTNNCHPIYYNEFQSGWYKRSCRPGYDSESKYRSIEAGAVYSFESVEDANVLAKEKLNEESQEWVEINCECFKVFDENDISLSEPEGFEF